MGVYINNGLYLQMYGFLRNTQAIYQIILLLSDKTHLSGRKNLGWHLLQESALLYSSELICEICVRIDCRCSADYKSGSRRPLAVGVGGYSDDFYTSFSELGGFTLSVNVCCGFIICVWGVSLAVFLPFSARVECNMCASMRWRIK